MNAPAKKIEINGRTKYRTHGDFSLNRADNTLRFPHWLLPGDVVRVERHNCIEQWEISYPIDTLHLSFPVGEDLEWV